MIEMDSHVEAARLSAGASLWHVYVATLLHLSTGCLPYSSDPTADHIGFLISHTLHRLIKVWE